VIGAGRTDAGVHAAGQVVSLITESGLPTDRVALALNGRLPRDNRARWARERDDRFHARFSARQRTYRYAVRRAGRPSVFLDRFSLLETRDLDLDAMRKTADLLLGSHEFRSFGSPEPGRTGVRDLRRVGFREWGCWLFVSLTANAFLKGMARTLTAQLLSAGRGEVSPLGVADRLKEEDRGVAGKAAPPNGLYLARVDYDT
jgi:tRNA pseudouridine38-40 synthase